MANHNINFKNLIRQLLPSHKLQPNRLVWVNALLTPLQKLFDDFVVYRTQTRRTMRVTSQVRLFEGYLQTKYNEPISIKLITYDDGALNVGFVKEGDTMSVNAPLIGEATEDDILIPQEFEIRDILFEGADFIIYIPQSLGEQIDNVRADIERFKQALTTYKIVQR